MGMYFGLLLVLILSSPLASYAVDINIGPLTTTFTPASTCLDVTVAFDPVYPIHYVFAGPANLFFSRIITPNPAEPCFPFFDIFSNNSQSVFFSPGVCPLGYSTAYSTTVGDETQAACCPTGYTASTTAVDDENFGSCQSPQTGPVTASAYITLGPNENGILTHGPYTIPTSAFTGNQLEAVPVSIRYRAADFSATASSTKFGGFSASNRPTSSVVASKRPPSTVVGRHTLSPGAKIGIAVGSVIGVIAILGGIFGFVLFRRRRKRNEAGAASNGGGPGELHGTSAQKHELHDSRTQQSELQISPTQVPAHVAISDPLIGGLNRGLDSEVHPQELGDPRPAATELEPRGLPVPQGTALPLNSGPSLVLPSAQELDSSNTDSVRRKPLPQYPAPTPLLAPKNAAGPVPMHLETAAHPQLRDQDLSYDCLLLNCSRKGDEAFSLESLRDKHLREYHGLTGEEVDLIKARRKGAR
jgi:hypothetical protein